jgi:hypothetical protein
LDLHQLLESRASRLSIDHSRFASRSHSANSGCQEFVAHFARQKPAVANAGALAVDAFPAIFEYRVTRDRNTRTLDRTAAPESLVRPPYNWYQSVLLDAEGNVFRIKQDALASDGPDEFHTRMSDIIVKAGAQPLSDDEAASKMAVLPQNLNQGED